MNCLILWLNDVPQYAVNLENLTFPDTSVIIKAARRALYRSN